MNGAGEVLVWFIMGAILVNIIMHAPQFTAASNASFGFANSLFGSLTSKK